MVAAMLRLTKDGEGLVKHIPIISGYDRILRSDLLRLSPYAAEPRCAAGVGTVDAPTPSHAREASGENPADAAGQAATASAQPAPLPERGPSPAGTPRSTGAGARPARNPAAEAERGRADAGAQPAHTVALRPCRLRRCGPSACLRTGRRRAVLRSPPCAALRGPAAASASLPSWPA